MGLAVRVLPACHGSLQVGRYVSARFGRPAASPLVDAREPSRFGYSHWLAVPTSAHTRVIVDQIGNHTQSSRVWQMHLASDSVIQCLRFVTGSSHLQILADLRITDPQICSGTLLVVRIFKFLRIAHAVDPITLNHHAFGRSIRIQCLRFVIHLQILADLRIHRSANPPDRSGALVAVER